MTTTGKRFKNIRISLNLSQEAFGKEIGLSKSGISAVENEKTFVSLEILSTLLIDYNINMNYLVGGIGEMFNPTGSAAKTGKKPNGPTDIEFKQKVIEILREEGLIK